VELVDDGPPVAPAAERLFTGGEDVGLALEQVPESFRTAILLRDVQEFSYQEIARILDVPIGTVMSRIHRGRALLKRALGKTRP
jgi:RNA polymerase sigma-70 factor (ECF subfamily)